MNDIFMLWKINIGSQLRGREKGFCRRLELLCCMIANGSSCYEKK
jgi:hypothetical protein